MVEQGSTGPEFWFPPVPCSHGGLFHDAETADHFRTTKIFKCSLNESRCPKCPETILLSEQSCFSLPFLFLRYSGWSTALCVPFFKPFVKQVFGNISQPLKKCPTSSPSFTSPSALCAMVQTKKVSYSKLYRKAATQRCRARGLSSLSSFIWCEIFWKNCIRLCD